VIVVLVVALVVDDECKGMMGEDGKDGEDIGDSSGISAETKVSGVM